MVQLRVDVKFEYISFSWKYYCMYFGSEIWYSFLTQPIFVVFWGSELHEKARICDQSKSLNSIDGQATGSLTHGQTQASTDHLELK